MTDQEKLHMIEAEIESLRQLVKKSNDRIQILVKDQSKILIKMNRHHFGDMEWLIKNPTMPGSHEALNKKIIEMYGGEYNGVHPSGYVQNENYEPIQKSFEFHVEIYSNENRKEKEQIYKDNIRHFVANCLKYFQPFMTVGSRWNDTYPEVDVVAFRFASEDTGLEYLGYDPDEKVWYHFSMVYGTTDVKKKFNNFEEALDFIFTFSYNSDND